MAQDSDWVASIDLSEVEECRLERAQFRKKAIEPLLELNEITKEAVIARAHEVGRSPATLYRAVCDRFARRHARWPGVLPHVAG